MNNLTSLNKTYEYAQFLENNDASEMNYMSNSLLNCWSFEYTKDDEIVDKTNMWRNNAYHSPKEEEKYLSHTDDSNT